MTKYSVSIIRLQRSTYTGYSLENVDAGRIERTFDQYKLLMFFVNSYLKKHGYKPHDILYSHLQGVNIYADNKIMVVWREHED